MAPCDDRPGIPTTADKSMEGVGGKGVGKEPDWQNGDGMRKRADQAKEEGDSKGSDTQRILTSFPGQIHLHGSMPTPVLEHVQLVQGDQTTIGAYLRAREQMLLYCDEASTC